MLGKSEKLKNSSFSFSSKVIWLVLLTVLIVGSTTFFSAYYFFSKGFDEQAENGISLNAVSVQKALDDAVDRVKKNALSFSTRPDLADAIADKDTKLLQEIARTLLSNNSLEVLTIADVNGNVLARGHSEKVGDSVANQINVKKALAGEVSAGIEEGTVVKFSIRAGAPVKVDGRIVGTVTPGIDLTATNAFVDKIKQQFNVECTIFKSEERASTTLEKNGKRMVGTKLDNPVIIDTVLNKGQKFFNKNTIDGRIYNTAYWPLQGADGKIGGMLFIGVDRTVLEKTSQSVISAVLISALIVGLLMIFMGYGLARSIVKPILNTIGGLNGSVQEVSTAAENISSSSQRFAEGASQQAASIEETSSSLEEMASMTKQNADNATQADKLMTVTKDTVSRAGKSMEGLATSMGEISRASEETSKIIKTIDEIAFQTNLLALNAAVEAARAGEAGAGFAVVADEVRNLALRAAEAAKSTANLIEGTVKKIKEGSELVVKTENEFREAAASVGRSKELVGEISAASLEQAQGIEQVNKAVAEMDKVVQQNAANAEESASASEEMNAQARQLKTYVGMLKSLVEGSKTTGRNAPRTISAGRPVEALSVPESRIVTKLKANGKCRNGMRKDAAGPERLVSMEEFSNF